jgi:hypothetical protein
MADPACVGSAILKSSPPLPESIALSALLFLATGPAAESARVTSTATV